MKRLGEVPVVGKPAPGVRALMKTPQWTLGKRGSSALQ